VKRSQYGLVKSIPRRSSSIAGWIWSAIWNARWISNQTHCNRLNATSVQTQHLAASLGTNSWAIENLIAKRMA